MIRGFCSVISISTWCIRESCPFDLIVASLVSRNQISTFCGWDLELRRSQSSNSAKTCPTELQHSELGYAGLYCNAL